jgi:hypothetical protein
MKKLAALVAVATLALSACSPSGDNPCTNALNRADEILVTAEKMHEAHSLGDNRRFSDDADDLDHFKARYIESRDACRATLPK